MVSCGDFRINSGSTLGAALSLAVTTMGAGILTLPSAYADAGIIPATLMLIGVAIFTVFSVDFIILGVDKLGRNSYEELTRELLGRRMAEVVRWMLIIYNTGAAISYLVVVEDLVAPLQPLVTRHFPLLTTPKHTLLAVWVVLILPLSCVPTLGALHISSFLAISATSLICCMIIFRYFVPGPTPPSAITLEAVANGTASPTWWWGINPLLALPIIMFSFDCQSLVFQIYAGLDDMRRSNMMKVSIISLVVTGVIHAAVGFFGYLSNPVDVRGNIISNYDPNVDRLFTVGYILYAAPIILAFVIMLFPIRDSIFILWYGYSSASVATHVPRSKDFTRLVDQEEKLELLSQAENEIGVAPRKAYGSVEEELQHVVEAKKQHNNVETIPPRDHLIISITLSTLCLTVALIVPGIVTVVSLLGGVCSSTLCFLVPGLYRWEMHYKNIARCHNVLEWCVMTSMVLLAGVATVLGTAVSVQDVFFSH
ncbi:Amino acid permease-like protein [Lotmaria passim]